MIFSEMQRKVVLIIVVVSSILFFVELIMARYGFLFIEGEMSRIKLGLLLSPPLLSSVLTSLLTYDKWTRTRHKEIYAGIIYGFFVFLSFCIVVLIIALYIFFVI